MSTLLAVPDSFRPRASSAGTDLFSLWRGPRSHDKIPKSRTLPKNSNGGAKAENRSIVTFLQETMSRRRGSHERDSYEAAMARLDEEISRIRSDLSSLRTEGKSMEQRVAGVTVSVEQMVGKHRPVTSNNRLSLGAIAESDCESLEEEEEEEEETDVETSRMLSKFYRSTASLPCSNRDSGIGTDPAFEMTDPEKYCLLNNFIYSSSNQKKARSTTAIDFIKNDLHEDSGRKLKATSYDRLSCVSDSALTTFAVRRRIL